MRGFRSSSLGEQASWARRQVPVVPQRDAEEGQSAASRTVKSCSHCPKSTSFGHRTSQFIDCVCIRSFTFLLGVGQGTCSHHNFQGGETLKCSDWEYSLFQRGHRFIYLAKK